MSQESEQKLCRDEQFMIHNIELCKEMLDLSELEEVEEILHLLKLHIHNIPKEVQTKKNYKQILTEFETRLKQMRKDKLFESNLKTSTSLSPSESKVQLSNTKQDRSLYILKQARRQLEETEQIGQSTLNQLLEQKEQIQQVKSNVEQTNENIKYSRKIVNKISQWWRN